MSLQGGQVLETMMQWDSLKSYFLPNFDLDHDPTENNPDEKISREKRLVNAFKQTVSKQYAIFVQSLIPASDIFNTFLQAKLRNHWFIYCIILLCICIAHYFQGLSYLKLSQNQMMCQVLILRALISWRILTVYLLDQGPSNLQWTVTSLELLSTIEYNFFVFLKDVR